MKFNPKIDMCVWNVMFVFKQKVQWKDTNVFVKIVASLLVKDGLRNILVNVAIEQITLCVKIVARPFVKDGLRDILLNVVIQIKKMFSKT
jgi:hypothetical protein